MPVGAIIASVVGAAASAGIGAALAPGAPGAPDLVAGNREGVLADAETLAARRAIERAARLGLSTDYETGRTAPSYEDRQFVRMFNPAGVNLDERSDGALTPSGNSFLVPYREQDWQLGGKYYRLDNQGRVKQPELVSRKVYLGEKPETKTANFTGLGDAQLQSEQAEKLALAMLKLRQDLAPEFIAQSRKELELADPLGQAARRKLNELIMADAARAGNERRPLADELERQLLEEQQAGGGLTGEQTDRLDAALAQASLARGGSTLDPEAFHVERAGADEFARLLDRGGRGQQFLTSGATPEDVAFRRQQQVMANEAAFLGGRTPTAQFGQLAGAQQGAAPFQPSNVALPGTNPGAGASGAAFAAQNYSQQVQNVLNEPNPWYAGLSIALKGAKAAI